MQQQQEGVGFAAAVAGETMFGLASSQKKLGEEEIMKARAMMADYHRTVNIWFFEERGEHGLFGAPPIKLEKQNYDEINEPTARISREAAQLLMDDLWEVGLRPSEGTGSAGSLAATERHLEDMRVIAGKFLEVDLGKSKG